LGLHGAQATVSILLVATGFMAYWFRMKYLRMYGIVEVVFGTACAFSVFIWDRCEQDIAVSMGDVRRLCIHRPTGTKQYNGWSEKGVKELARVASGPGARAALQNRIRSETPVSSRATVGRGPLL
jgi:hypothetical protein